MTIEELIALVEKGTPGGLTEQKKNILRAYYKKGDEEFNKDYVYGLDEGEVNKGDLRE